MSSRLAALCFSVVIVNVPITAQAQSASKVIEQYIAAIGGKKAVEKIVSADVSGSITSADGRSGVFTQRTRRPQHFYLSMSWSDARWRTGFNGRSAWQEDSSEGLRTLFGEAASRVRAEASYANSRLLLSETVNHVLANGRAQVRGRQVVVVVALTPDGMRRTLFFDARSYLLVKDEQQTEAGVEERFFDDYRPVDEVMEPHRIEWHRTGETFLISVERITHNAPPGGQEFDVPAAPSEPSLDIDAVLSALGRNEQGAQSVRASYAYTQAMTIRTIDKQGRVTEREGSTYEVFHLGGQPVGRLVRMGGRPLGEAARRREDERVNNVVREYERQRLSGRAARPRQEESGATGYVLRNLWGSLVIRVPVMTAGWFPAYRRIADFSHIRRERVRGRAFVVVEFQPMDGVVPNGDVERQASTMAGTLWIDEASQQVIRIESHFVDDYDSIVQGSSVWMEQTLVNDEVWLPSRIETNLRRRLGFGALAQPLITVRFTDHKKFSVETDSRLMPDVGR
jgi:hypothetical protein